MKLKIVVSFLFSLMFSSMLEAQDFDSSLEQLAQKIAKSISGQKKQKIAVWGFVTENGEQTALGNYITEDFSVYLTNYGDNIEIIDRNHLNVLLQEHQLNSEGYIDETTAKQLGKIIAVDAVVTGTYTVLNSSVKVRVKVLNTETALQFAANMANLPLNENISSYLGINTGGGIATNKGFNRPINSNETVNNPETVDEKCEDENFGDLCLLNSTRTDLVVRLKHFRDDEGSRMLFTDIFLAPGETKCVYKLKARELSYYAVERTVFEKDLEGGLYKLHQDPTARYLKDRGEIKVEKCQSKTYTFR